ncbi:hypothetical protein GCM10010521_14000 [Streptomyces rameus]|uniref:Uncharacterized protein n=1 Tax=Streptomyces rameus TaxID=68261 RepID=A0ABP6MZZ1_9ACTN
MGVQGAECAGLVLHAGGRGLPAAAEPGEHVHGVVAGAEEDPAPEVGHLVGVPFLDADQAAALADVRQFLVPHGVLEPAGQCRQHGEREQGLERARGGQFAVGVARGEHLPAAGVGDEPGESRELGHLGRALVRSDLRAGVVEQGRPGHRRPGTGRGGFPAPGSGGGSGGRERQQARHTEGADRHSCTV